MPIPNDALQTLPPQPLDKVSRVLRNGDLLLCSGKDPFSRLIAFGSGAPWSHIAIAYRWSSIGRIMVFESVERIGVRAVPLKTFISRDSGGHTPYPGKILLARHSAVADRLGEPGSDRTVRMADFAVDRFGYPFAPMEIVKIGLRLLLGATNARMPKMLMPKDEFICSEYVAGCLEALGITIPWDGRGFIAPVDFAQCAEVHAIAQIQTL